MTHTVCVLAAVDISQDNKQQKDPQHQLHYSSPHSISSNFAHSQLQQSSSTDQNNQGGGSFLEYESTESISSNVLNNMTGSSISENTEFYIHVTTTKQSSFSQEPIEGSTGSRPAADQWDIFSSGASGIAESEPEELRAASKNFSDLESSSKLLQEKELSSSNKTDNSYVNSGATPYTEKCSDIISNVNITSVEQDILENIDYNQNFTQTNLIETLCETDITCALPEEEEEEEEDDGESQQKVTNKQTAQPQQKQRHKKSKSSCLNNWPEFEKQSNCGSSTYSSRTLQQLHWAAEDQELVATYEDFEESQIYHNFYTHPHSSSQTAGPHYAPHRGQNIHGRSHNIFNRWATSAGRPNSSLGGGHYYRETSPHSHEGGFISTPFSGAVGVTDPYADLVYHTSVVPDPTFESSNQYYPSYYRRGEVEQDCSIMMEDTITCIYTQDGKASEVIESSPTSECFYSPNIHDVKIRSGSRTEKTYPNMEVDVDIDLHNMSAMFAEIDHLSRLQDQLCVSQEQTIHQMHINYSYDNSESYEEVMLASSPSSFSISKKGAAGIQNSVKVPGDTTPETSAPSGLKPEVSQVNQSKLNYPEVCVKRDKPEEQEQTRPLSEVILSPNFLEQLTEKLDADAIQETVICEDNLSGDETETGTGKVSDKNQDLSQTTEAKTQSQSDTNPASINSSLALERNANKEMRGRGGSGNIGTNINRSTFQFNKVHETLTSAFGTLKFSFSKKSGNSGDDTLKKRKEKEPIEKSNPSQEEKNENPKNAEGTMFEIINDSDSTDKPSSDCTEADPFTGGEYVSRQAAVNENSSFEELETTDEVASTYQTGDEDGDPSSWSPFDEVTLSEIEEKTGRTAGENSEPMSETFNNSVVDLVQNVVTDQLTKSESELAETVHECEQKQDISDQPDSETDLTFPSSIRTITPTSDSATVQISSSFDESSPPSEILNGISGANEEILIEEDLLETDIFQVTYSVSIDQSIEEEEGNQRTRKDDLYEYGIGKTETTQQFVQETKEVYSEETQENFFETQVCAVHTSHSELDRACDFLPKSSLDSLVNRDVQPLVTSFPDIYQFPPSNTKAVCVEEREEYVFGHRQCLSSEDELVTPERGARWDGRTASGDNDVIMMSSASASTGRTGSSSQCDEEHEYGSPSCEKKLFPETSLNFHLQEDCFKLVSLTSIETDSNFSVSFDESLLQNLAPNTETVSSATIQSSLNSFVRRSSAELTHSVIASNWAKDILGNRSTIIEENSKQGNQKLSEKTQEVTQSPLFSSRDLKIPPEGIKPITKATMAIELESIHLEAETLRKFEQTINLQELQRKEDIFALCDNIMKNNNNTPSPEDDKKGNYSRFFSFVC